MWVVMVDARTARYLACADAESLVALHQEMLTSYGFRCFIYATNPIAAEFGKTGHAHDNRILHNCPKTLIAGYVGENLSLSRLSHRQMGHVQHWCRTLDAFVISAT